MKTLFIADPLETFDITKDSTYSLMQAAHKRNHTLYFCKTHDIALKNSRLEFKATKITPTGNPKTPFKYEALQTIDAATLNLIFIRPDPPFNKNYLELTWLLEFAPEHVKVVNNPTGIRTVNEKIWACQFTDITPETLITNSKADYSNFIKTHKTIIAKPTDGYGGMGIFKIQEEDPNKNSIFEQLSQNETQNIILQPYLKEAQAGDKRILLLGGEPLGAVLRCHGKDDHRNNIFAGGTTKPAEITPQDQTIIKTLKPHLIKLGLSFVGIDIIGEKLIEVNVTSPTCLVELCKFTGQPLNETVIKYVE